MRFDMSRAVGAYAGVVTIALVWTMAAGAAAPPTRFDEIDVQRINIREPDGTLRMVISNRERMPGIIDKGREIPKTDKRAAGVLFFNDEGNENGGLIFSGRKVGDQAMNSGSLTFDRYGQDQTIQFSSSESGATRNAGISIIDRPDRVIDYDAASRAQSMPDGPAKNAAYLEAGINRAPRAFLGRLADNSSTLVLRDSQGRPRLVLRVAAGGRTGIDFLDDAGHVLHTVD